MAQSVHCIMIMHAYILASKASVVFVILCGLKEPQTGPDWCRQVDPTLTERWAKGFVAVLYKPLHGSPHA